MEGLLLMSRKELHRKSVLELVLAGRLTLVQAPERTELSYRQPQINGYSPPLEERCGHARDKTCDDYQTSFGARAGEKGLQCI
jgi:hypothetical protein